MSDKLSKRQEQILRFMRYGDTYGASDIVVLLADAAPSPATLRRDMQALELRTYVLQEGQNRAARYGKTVQGALYTPYDPPTYYSKREEERGSLEAYQFGYLDSLGQTLFSDDERTQLDRATKQYHERSGAAAPGVQKRELERFVIEFSWKSSAIEGNTYTLLDTERLLKDGQEAVGHSKEEAVMILNHKRAFSFAQQLTQGKVVTRRWVEDLHATLVEGLDVARGVRRGEVGVLGTPYRPLSVPSQIEEELDRLCLVLQSFNDPYSQALLALVGTSYLQPFEDGNKRTARLFANALLLQNGLAPLSYRNTDVRTYRESMLVFYEQLSIVPMIHIFVQQYKYASSHYLLGSS